VSVLSGSSDARLWSGIERRCWREDQGQEMQRIWANKVLGAKAAEGREEDAKIEERRRDGPTFHRRLEMQQCNKRIMSWVNILVSMRTVNASNFEFHGNFGPFLCKFCCFFG
jgi:hypothetical protein